MTTAVLQAAGTIHEGEIEIEEVVVSSNVRRAKPVESRGDRVIFRPESMTTDWPYPFEFEGVRLVAVKRSDGRVDFYQLS